MARLEKTGNDAKIVLSEKDVQELGELKTMEFALHAATRGVWVLVAQEAGHAGAEKLPAQPGAGNVDMHIFELLESKSMSERVEGKFEQLLSGAEQQRLQELLAQGKIEKFKLNESYKKAVYQKAGARKKESEKPGADEKEIEQYTLEQDGFLVVKNEERAKRLSHELEERIKDKSVRGTKSFDGHFYIVEAELLDRYREKACTALEGGHATPLSEVAEKLNISRLLARIICEFLKEDGEIIEKRKELYQVV